ncbi:MAG TPA: patatin-like phospholipase family protein, partial [Spirochaetota bacterium]|nr:patatin-like phospholipase family protein [Spirochaetota bacterium]
YVQPSQPSPIAKWDYTSPRGIQEVFDLGRRDGEYFAKTYSVL